MKFIKIFIGILSFALLPKYAQAQFYNIKFLAYNNDSFREATLILDAKKSLYQTPNTSNDDLQSKTTTEVDDEGTRRVNMNIAIEAGKPLFNFKNHHTDTMVSQDLLGVETSDYILVKEDIPNIQWEIFDEEKVIADTYRCKKAMAKFRGRIYTVWFTEEIPIPSGPWKLGGLPGLILEVEEEEKIFSFRFVSLKKIDQEINIESEVEKLKADPEQKPVTWQKYKSMHKESYEKLKAFAIARIKSMVKDKYGIDMSDDDISDQVKISETVSPILEKSLIEEDDKQ